MPKHLLAPGIEIRFHRETIRVDHMMPFRKPDEAWKTIDSHGHAHVWINGELPTLGEVVVGKDWVGNDDVDGCEINITEYHCLACGDTVVPGYKTSYESVNVPGPSEYTLTILAGFSDREYRIPPDDVGPLAEILQRVFE